MKKIVICLLLLLITTTSYCDDLTRRREPKKDKRNYWYRVSVCGEILGKGLIYSINLEYRFKKWIPRFAINVGYGYFYFRPEQWPNTSDETRYFNSIPAGFSICLGNNGNYLELALGYSIIEKNFDFYNLDRTLDSLSFYYGVIGYRFHGPKGYFFRVFYSPYYGEINGFEPFFVGTSFGYILGNRKKKEKAEF